MKNYKDLSEYYDKLTWYDISELPETGLIDGVVVEAEGYRHTLEGGQVPDRHLAAEYITYSPDKGEWRLIDQGCGCCSNSCKIARFAYIQELLEKE